MVTHISYSHLLYIILSGKLILYTFQKKICDTVK